MNHAQINKAPGKLRFRLRLYIAGRGPYATRAERNLVDAAAEAGFDYELEVIDLCAEPHRALADRVVVTPTLVKLSPLPKAIVIGDLSDRGKIREALGCPG
jgi:circadian clock protein KaiB